MKEKNEYHPQAVFHASTYKLVALMEENPCKASREIVFSYRQVANKWMNMLWRKWQWHLWTKLSIPQPDRVAPATCRNIYKVTLELAIERKTFRVKQS